MAHSPEEAALPAVQHSDGSAAYSHNGYTILGTVNGPIEAQRRDELPEEAFVDVVDIALLPSLLQTSLLALLSSSVSLESVFTSASIAVDQYGAQIYDPSAQQAQNATSLHVFCFTSLGDLLLTQSAGHFSIETWETALKLATARCRGKHPDLSDPGHRTSMDSIEAPNLEDSLKAKVQKQVVEQQRWRGDQI
ncbi:MAG: hypothetical protein Q9191_002455 [Dirinaria sp. TL-2023a]